ncbi:RNA-directed DNA polymerase from mobile element jockey [Elysia marginata]|uniref:RNA-directed DNA polymerase from mobile element jockey n=1 Tax=Elysia marginata TaxID=1093978 RepID=A0AAV4IQ68_9GAST|nr:RNA-directed DNA polymerase from mobile element jockey [Elysia marginata]
MLKQLGSTGKLFLLSIINQSWKQGRTPRAWENAHVIPILNKDKDPKELKSYRPISLTTCMEKVSERMVNRRLYWLLENRGLLCEEQSGFRSASRSED